MGPHVPDFDFTRARRQPARCGKPFTVGAKDHRSHQVGVAGERRHRFAAGRVHQSHFFVAAHGQELAVGRIGDRSHGRDHEDLRLDVRDGQGGRGRRSFSRRGSLGAGVDPRLDRGDVGRWKRVATEGHPRLDLAFEHQDHPALATFAGNNDGSVRSALYQRGVVFHHEPAHFGGAGVTGHAVLDQEGLDLAGKAGCGVRGPNRRPRRLRSRCGRAAGGPNSTSGCERHGKKKPNRNQRPPPRFIGRQVLHRFPRPSSRSARFAVQILRSFHSEGPPSRNFQERKLRYSHLSCPT